MDGTSLDQGMNSYIDNPLVETANSAVLPREVCGRRHFFPLPLLWFSFVTLVIFILTPLRIAESDIWFHLRNAEQLISSHSLPRIDVYTFTSSGARLLNHEWLSELPYYAGYKAFGLQGLVAVNAVVLSLAFGAMYYLAYRRGASCGDAALFTIGAVVLGLFSCGPRMHNFGFLCLALLLVILERFQLTGKGLWLLPPLFSVWVNLHGSWAFGFVFMGIFLVSGLVKRTWGRVAPEPWPTEKRRKFLLAMAASGAALLLNPYGYELVLYPFDLLFRQQANVANVIEWQSVDFNTVWGRPALLLILLLFSLALSKARWTVRDVAMACFVLFASLTHIRFLLVAGMVLIPVVACKLEICPIHDPSKDNSWRNSLAAAAILSLLLWSYPTTSHLNAVIARTFPSDALRFMQQHNITGRLFNYYDFGGYIEWSAPTTKTFADGRTDIFVYNGVFDDYLKISNLEQPLELMDRYNIDYVLYQPSKPLSYLLAHTPEWQLMYASPVANLYRRVSVGGLAATLQPRRVDGHLMPNTKYSFRGML
jgi:hypothetical protein